MIFHLDRQENILEKRRKCWLPAFSPFLTMFSKGFFCRAVKTRDCFGKGKRGGGGGGGNMFYTEIICKRQTIGISNIGKFLSKIGKRIGKEILVISIFFISIAISFFFFFFFYDSSKNLLIGTSKT